MHPSSRCQENQIQNKGKGIWIGAEAGIGEEREEVTKNKDIAMAMAKGREIGIEMTGDRTEEDMKIGDKAEMIEDTMTEEEETTKIEEAETEIEIEIEEMIDDR